MGLEPTTAWTVPSRRLEACCPKCARLRALQQGERRDSNPRPPGPQPLERGICEAKRPGFIGLLVSGYQPVSLKLFPKLFPRLRDATNLELETPRMAAVVAIRRTHLRSV